METLTDNSPDWAWSCGEDRAHGILTQIRITSTASPSKVSRRSQYMHTDCPALDVSPLGCRFAEVVGKPDCMSFDWFYEAVMKKTKKTKQKPPAEWEPPWSVLPSAFAARPSSAPPKEKTRHFVLLSVWILSVAGWFWTETPLWDRSAIFSC